jgi:hypothetical protein
MPLAVSGREGLGEGRREGGERGRGRGGEGLKGRHGESWGYGEGFGAQKARNQVLTTTDVMVDTCRVDHTRQFVV